MSTQTTVPTDHDARAAMAVKPGRKAALGYWASTLFIASTALFAGIADILHLQPLYGLLLHLGYPPYFGAIIGTAKIIGAVVLIAPGPPLLKEWAYAGAFCDYASAIASHAASGDGAGAIAGPLLSMLVMAGSWYLRPPSRRLNSYEWNRRARPS